MGRLTGVASSPAVHRAWAKPRRACSFARCARVIGDMQMDKAEAFAAGLDGRAVALRSSM